MAKLQIDVNADFTSLLSRIEHGIIEGSMSASLEDATDIRGANSRCSIRVFERYSYFGGNRVSMTVVLFQEGDGPIRLTAVTSGGSQAMFFKINTVGEDAFLDKLREIL